MLNIYVALFNKLFCNDYVFCLGLLLSNAALLCVAANTIYLNMWHFVIFKNLMGLNKRAKK
jgi:hypothetical protein